MTGERDGSLRIPFPFAATPQVEVGVRSSCMWRMGEISVLIDCGSVFPATFLLFW